MENDRRLALVTVTFDRTYTGIELMQAIKAVADDNYWEQLFFEDGQHACMVRQWDGYNAIKDLDIQPVVDGKRLDAFKPDASYSSVAIMTMPHEMRRDNTYCMPRIIESVRDFAQRLKTVLAHKTPA
jgi:hypothetical protein